MKKWIFENYPFTLTVFKPVHEPLHATNSLSIICVIIGKLRLNNIVNGRVIEEGDIEFINVGELASCKGLQKGTVAAKITIALEFIKKKIPDIQNRVFNCKMTSFYSSRANSDGYDELKALMHNLIAGMIEGAFPGGNSIVKANKLLVLFQKEFEDIKNALRSVNETFHQERFIKIDHFLMANINKNLSLEDLGDIEFLSKPYLSKEFARLLKRNFKEIISYYRVSHACRLLLETGLSVTEISMDSGFSGARYFYKYFKQFLNMTPNDFRQHYKNKPYKYDDIPVHETDLIRKSVAKLIGRKTVSEKIIIHMDSLSDIAEFKSELSIELIVPVSQLMKKLYQYYLLKTFEQISVTSCRFIISKSDLKDDSILVIQNVLELIFKHFNACFLVILSVNTTINPIKSNDALLLDWIEKAIQTLKQSHPNVKFEPICFKRGQSQKSKEISIVIQQGLSSKLNLFICPDDIVSLGIVQDEQLSLFDDSFCITNEFIIVHMLSKLRGKHVLINEYMVCCQNAGDRANSLSYTILIHHLDGLTQKDVEIWSTDTMQLTKTLYYQKTNLTIYDEFYRIPIEKDDRQKNDMYIDLVSVSQKTNSQGNHVYSFYLEPGDIVVLDLPREQHGADVPLV